MSDIADLTLLIRDLEESSNTAPLAEPVLDEAAGGVFMAMTAVVPVDTSLLKSTIHIESQPGSRFIGPDHDRAPYDVYVAEGTKPHVIEPKKTGGVLVFQSGGQTVFAKRVNHPGTKPQPFDAMAIDMWRSSLGDKMTDVAVRRLTK